MPEETLCLDQLLPVMQSYFAAGKTVSFSPNGTSMRPMLESGRDTVVLSALPQQLRKNDVVLYRRADGSFVLHRLLQICDGQYIFCGDAQFTYETVQQEQLLAVLQSFIRKGKPCRTDALSYRLYVFFWNASRPLRYFAVRAAGRLKRLWHH